MIHKELIFLDLEAKDKQQAISLLADKLLAAGKVRDTYKDAVLIREQTYPTGLPRASSRFAGYDDGNLQSAGTARPAAQNSPPVCG